MERVAVYPGSFNPVHPGHLEVIRQATNLFDKVIVLVAINPNKKYEVPSSKRCEWIRNLIKNFSWAGSVKVESTDLSLSQYCFNHKINIVIKGIRNQNDLMSEEAQRFCCDIIKNDIEDSLTEDSKPFEMTWVYLCPSINYSHFSSTLIRQFAKVSYQHAFLVLYNQGWFNPQLSDETFDKTLKEMYKAYH